MARRRTEQRPGTGKSGKSVTTPPAPGAAVETIAERAEVTYASPKPAEVMGTPVFVEAGGSEPEIPEHNGHAPELELPVTPPAAPPPPVKEEPPLQPPLLFEIAWEVCWQLGGIYTVLRTKVESMVREWDDRYCLIGPYNPATAAIEFEERPTDGVIRQTLDRLREAGIPCHYGRWLVPGRPRVILLDYRARYASSDADKYLMWADHGIPTYASDGEVNDVVAFGFTVAEFFRHLSSIVTDRKILAHFHEWMGGVAVPRIAHMKLPIATVFTTHATILGRYLASDDPHFYDHLDSVNPDASAEHYRIYPRFAIERAAAHASTVFTTVSEVTAREATKLLGRQADVILPNGLQIHRFAALHEFQNLHREYKERIHEFVMGHFFPSYSFDLDRTLYMFTSGRYEYLNKGMDLYLESMWRLNQRLKQIPDPPTIVSFIITKAQVRSINVQALQGQAMFDELRSTCEQISEQMGRRLFQAAANGRLPGRDELLPDDAQVRLKRGMHAWRSNRQPLVVTHDLGDDANDPILKHIRHRGLFNAADDPVKIVFHPQFVSATGPLINLDYEQFVRGCHMGIFPSYYEPWGYTPMESVALGVPAVTTDLSGFGAYVEHHIENSGDQGICVLNRSTKGFNQTADDLADYLYNFVQLNRRQRIELRNKVERLSEMFDWSILGKHYKEAHNLALSRVGAGRIGSLEVRTV
ncbi:MAG TPA: glycosyltransferase [Tepidisphaeraceae bacterium]|jgi:glycogen(starch) synthase|nr:glycosyltransferase [Tepidisphaeraceae bacterium]